MSVLHLQNQQGDTANAWTARTDRPIVLGGERGFKTVSLNSISVNPNTSEIELNRDCTIGWQLRGDASANRTLGTAYISTGDYSQEEWVEYLEAALCWSYKEKPNGSAAPEDVLEWSVGFDSASRQMVYQAELLNPAAPVAIAWNDVANATDNGNGTVTNGAASDGWNCMATAKAKLASATDTYATYTVNDDNNVFSWGVYNTYGGGSPSVANQNGLAAGFVVVGRAYSTIAPDGTTAATGRDLTTDDQLAISMVVGQNNENHGYLLEIFDSTGARVFDSTVLLPNGDLHDVRTYYIVLRLYTAGMTSGASQQIQSAITYTDPDTGEIADHPAGSFSLDRGVMLSNQLGAYQAITLTVRPGEQDINFRPALGLLSDEYLWGAAKSWKNSYLIKIDALLPGVLFLEIPELGLEAFNTYTRTTNSAFICTLDIVEESGWVYRPPFQAPLRIRYADEKAISSLSVRIVDETGDPADLSGFSVATLLFQ